MTHSFPVMHSLIGAPKPTPRRDRREAGRPSHRALLCVSMLALTPFLLAMPRAATAQQLNLNTGTALIINDGTTSGTQVNSANYFFSGGASAATYQYKTVYVQGFDPSAALTLGVGSSVTTLNTVTFGTATINGGTVGTLSNQGTTVNVNAGSVDALSSSGTVNVSGGLVTNLRSGSLVNVGGGTVTTLNNGGSMGVINISGGTVGSLTNTPFGNVSISGGSIGSAQGTFAYGSTQQFSITGGLVGTLENITNSKTTISGGSIGTFINDRGDPFQDPFAVAGVLAATGGSIGTLKNSGVVTVRGGQFTFLDNALGTINVYGSGLTLANGFLIGSLQDGESIHAAYQTEGGVLNLFNTAPVPEASTTASFGLLLALGAGGLVLAARRKRTAVQASSAL